jgi:aspartyl aminopeptidase
MELAGFGPDLLICTDCGCLVHPDYSEKHESTHKRKARKKTTAKKTTRRKKRK